tara:strand:- start:186 stop:719 length:534 start_codon:yes stop_codon:yes gene_type:complete
MKAGMARGMGAMSQMQGTAAYQGMTNTFGGKMTVSLTYGQVILITMLAASYLVVASLGIDMFGRCTELKGVKLQENLNKWLVATLAIAIAIPCTLMTVRVAGSKLTGLMMLLFAIFGIVGSSAVLNWNNKCKAVEESEKIYGGINMAVFILMLLASFFLLRAPGPKKFGPMRRNGTY